LTERYRAAEISFVVAHKWEFKARFRRRAFGWKSQPPIQRVKQAVAEIKKVARLDPLVAADGAVTFLERVSPALENVDGSSGAIGTTVNNAIADLVPIVAGAPADPKTRDAWLERLWEAHNQDQIPYIESLAEYWGELCASKEVASEWADRLVDITRMALGQDKTLRGHFNGSTACLSALFHAGRHTDIADIVQFETFWPYKRWAVKALVAAGQPAEAIRYAESCRGPYSNDLGISAVCEEILLASGRVEEAYSRYGVVANQGGTYLGTFRAVAKKYPWKAAADILADLVKTTPGDEGKWFAAAKEAGLYDEALALAGRTPCDPKTLTRAARDFAVQEPAFAVGAGLLAIHWLVQGYGYEITGADVWSAFSSTMGAASQQGNVAETRERIRKMVASETLGSRFVTRFLAAELGL
jgi:hypothetical protein